MARNQGQKTSTDVILSNNPLTDAYGQYYFDSEASELSEIYPGYDLNDIGGGDLFTVSNYVGDNSALTGIDDMNGDPDNSMGNADILDNPLDRIYPGYLWPYKGFKITPLKINIPDASKDTLRDQLGIYICSDQHTCDGLECSGIGVYAACYDITQATNGNDINTALGINDSVGAGSYLVYHEQGHTGWNGYTYWPGGSDRDLQASGDVYIADFPYNPVSSTAAGTLGTNPMPVYNNSHLRQDYNSLNGWHYQLTANNDVINLPIEEENFVIAVKLAGDAEEVGYHNTDNRNRSFYVFKIPKKWFYDLVLYKDIKTLKLVWGNHYGDAPGYYDSTGALVSVVDVINMPARLTDSYGDNDDYSSFLGVTTDDEKRSPAWSVNGFAVEISAPDDIGYELNSDPSLPNFGGANYFPLGDGVTGLSTEMNWLNNPMGDGEQAGVWVKQFGLAETSYPLQLNPDNRYKNFSPDNAVDYLSLNNEYNSFANFTHSNIPDFRPLTFISTRLASEEFNLQRYWDDDSIEFQYTSAPNVVYLALDIVKGFDDFYPEYLDEAKWVSHEVDGSGEDDYAVNTDNVESTEVGYKFCVVRWGDTGTEITDALLYDELRGIKGLDSEANLVDYLSTPDVTYKWQEVRSGPTKYGYLDHQYNEPGLYIIRGFVFSYIKHPSQPEFIQALKWKMFKSQIYINLSDVSIEDFSDIGGPDFVSLPWPYPGQTPIVSGLSDRSRYTKSISVVSNSDKFKKSEKTDQNLIIRAYNNDELGNYIGKTDLQQLRVFNDGTMGMSKLLKLDGYNGIIKGDKFYKHNNSLHWNGEWNIFPAESSVGKLFINDNLDRSLQTKCLFEFNFDNMDGDFFSDSSGNGNKAILIGDYSISKHSKNTPVSRESSMSTPGLGENNKAAI